MSQPLEHPILGVLPSEPVTIYYDGQPVTGAKGQTVAAILLANGVRTFRYTRKHHHPRGVFCGIGQCTDCVMVVDDVPNVRTCVTEAQEGMRVQTQYGDHAREDGERG